ncbi:hypothetical protein Lesp02_14590 [Lentzea sp. NBRC 105346]|nr:hypothetical protein Lesp02_14590 [Lentzea sp. NBRC 105346]
MTAFAGDSSGTHDADPVVGLPSATLVAAAASGALTTVIPRTTNKPTAQREKRRRGDLRMVRAPIRPDNVVKRRHQKRYSRASKRTCAQRVNGFAEYSACQPTGGAIPNQL